MSERVVLLQSSHAAHHPRHHHRFAAALAAAGHDVTTMAQPDLEGGHLDAVPVRYLPRRRNRLTRMLSGPLTVARALRLRPSVLTVVSLDLLPWAVLARLLRRDLVVLYDSNEQYDLYVEIKDWIPGFARRPIAAVVRWLEPRLAARLDAVTTAVPATQDKFRSAGARTTLVRNLPPAVLLEQQRRTDAFAYDVLVGGSLPPAQVRFVAETAARLEALLGRPARWIVVVRHLQAGDQDLVEATLRQHGVRDQVTLLHDRPFDEVRALAAESAVAFAPYPGDAHYRVALPIRVFEYMAWGMPFVTSDLPTLADLVGAERAGLLVDPGDCEGYARALAELLEDPTRARRLGENGRRAVRRGLTWESEASRLVALYGSLAGRRT
jgi:glycosyltransferase involved in cell wall biosynthesis